MIRLLIGENSFEIDRAVRALTNGFDGLTESIDGSSLVLERLPDLFMGTSLFSPKRLVVIKNLSDNKVVWPLLGEWLPRIADEIELVFIEPKPDKRTKSFKDLQKVATIEEYKEWSERDSASAERWMMHEAKSRGVPLDKKQVNLVVQRVGLDQWALANALEKLAVLDEITEEVILDVIASSPQESVFQLFQTALDGKTATLQRMIADLSSTEDPYRLFGLLGGQAFQLAALIVADAPSGVVAQDIGAHPFALQKLEPYARTLHRVDANRIIAAFAEADAAMKNSGGEPWLLIERALLKTAAS